jgi:AmiR/NasT family two-component response regulator
MSAAQGNQLSTARHPTSSTAPQSARIPETAQTLLEFLEEQRTLAIAQGMLMEQRQLSTEAALALLLHRSDAVGLPAHSLARLVIATYDLP